MQSLIIVGPKEKSSLKVDEIIADNKISRFDKELIVTEKAVGIGDIRTLQKKIFLAPLEGEKKAVVLEAFFGMTNDSQNAFLKVLEEPPQSTVILILVNSLDFLLPTVLSRCKVIDLREKRKLSDSKTHECLALLSSSKNSSVALRIAQDYSKDKEVALDFLEDLIISVHKNLENDKQNAKILKKIQSTYGIIKTTNVNIRFALENLFLNIDN